jgi:hypothetical protein
VARSTPLSWFGTVSEEVSVVVMGFLLSAWGVGRDVARADR